MILEIANVRFIDLTAGALRSRRQRMPWIMEEESIAKYTLRNLTDKCYWLAILQKFLLTSVHT